MRRTGIKNKQGDMNAAILVALIAGLIVIYILFLPSVDREELLEGEGSRSGSIDDKDRVLLREPVGHLSVGRGLEERKDIPNVFLFETTNAKVLSTINPFVAEKGWFNEQGKTASFKLDDLPNTDNVYLSFTVNDAQGILIILLNGNPIFEGEVPEGNVEPIVLDKDLLTEDNTLAFMVSGVGLKFWTTNRYSLSSVKVTGDITDRSKQESQNIFTLSEDEYENLEDAELRFVPYCGNAATVGVLDILINNRNVFSAVPVCEDPYRQTLPTGLLNEGQNRVVFKTGRGSYSVEQIAMELEYEETVSKTYFFEINQTLYDDIIEENEEVVLRMEFTEDDEDKRGVLDVNGHLRSFDQEERDFSEEITRFIEEGNNFVRIQPETELNIVELLVEIEED